MVLVTHASTHAGIAQGTSGATHISVKDSYAEYTIGIKTALFNL